MRVVQPSAGDRRGGVLLACPFGIDYPSSHAVSLDLSWIIPS